jgi:hypothetical protein
MMLVKKKNIYVCIALAAVFALTACHPKVTPVSNMDKELSCAALSSEIKDVENIKTKIEANRGFSGRNVGLALLFWPGVVINEVTGSTAEAEANARLVALKNLYFEKNCSKQLAESKKDEKSDKA